MDNEYIVMPPIISSKSPFKIMLAGITYENPDYVIERYGMDIFTVEYVISGRGYIELDGKNILRKPEIHIFLTTTKDTIIMQTRCSRGKKYGSMQPVLF